MSDLSFANAVAIIAAAKRQPTGVSTKVLFDHYITSSPPLREAFVLAMIGEVLTCAVRKSSFNVVRPAPANLAEAS